MATSLHNSSVNLVQVLTSLQPIDYALVAFLPGISEVSKVYQHSLIFF